MKRFLYNNPWAFALLVAFGAFLLIFSIVRIVFYLDSQAPAGPECYELASLSVNKSDLSPLVYQYTSGGKMNKGQCYTLTAAVDKHNENQKISKFLDTIADAKKGIKQ